jgi:hypothetical protein
VIEEEKQSVNGRTLKEETQNEVEIKERHAHELVKRVTTENEVFIKYPVIASEVMIS